MTVVEKKDCPEKKLLFKSPQTLPNTKLFGKPDPTWINSGTVSLLNKNLKSSSNGNNDVFKKTTQSSTINISTNLQ